MRRRGRCRDCDRLVSTIQTERCRACNGRLMRQRHRRWRELRAQGLASVAKRARAVVRRLNSIAQNHIETKGVLHV